MSQNNTVMAYRKRMKNRGYTDIVIEKTKFSGLWNVSAVEPALRCRVSSTVDERSMMMRCTGRRSDRGGAENECIGSV